MIAKFWLAPVRLANSGGFNRAELRDMERLVEENSPVLLEAGNEYFGA